MTNETSVLRKERIGIGSQILPRVAVLDDYEGVARQYADWGSLDGKCTIDFLTRKLNLPDEAATLLGEYDVLCHLRERTPMPATLIDRLPRLKFMTVTGKAHRTLNLDAATARGVVVSHASFDDPPSHGTPELAWGLILAVARRIPCHDRQIREGNWEKLPGIELYGKTLGVLGLGKLGRRLASYGQAFGMNVIAWSPNLTEEEARKHGARWVDKDMLFSQSDVLSVHMVLGERSHHLVAEADLRKMKASAIFVNTARGAIVDEQALVRILVEGKIAGAGLDVFETEPLPLGHKLLGLDNVVFSPHAGYVTHDTFRRFYEGTVTALDAYLRGKPQHILNPQVLL